MVSVEAGSCACQRGHRSARGAADAADRLNPDTKAITASTIGKRDKYKRQIWERVVVGIAAIAR